MVGEQVAKSVHEDYLTKYLEVLETPSIQAYKALKFALANEKPRQKIWAHEVYSAFSTYLVAHTTVGMQGIMDYSDWRYDNKILDGLNLINIVGYNTAMELGHVGLCELEQGKKPKILTQTDDNGVKIIDDIREGLSYRAVGHRATELANAQRFKDLSEVLEFLYTNFQKQREVSKSL